MFSRIGARCCAQEFTTGTNRAEARAAMDIRRAFLMDFAPRRIEPGCGVDLILPDTGILSACGIFRSIYSEGGSRQLLSVDCEVRNRSSEAGARVEWGVRVRSAKPGLLWATRRCKARIAASTARHPYSSGITQPGSAPHPCPSARKCHCT